MNLTGKIIISALAATVCNTLAAIPEYYGLAGSEGLSNSSVMCMTQDSKGLLWIGTWDGLNVYDSYQFDIYRNDPDDDNTISNNIIYDIEEQMPGVMWVSTNYGINRIETDSWTIQRFYPGYEHKYPLVEKTFSVAIVDGKDVFCAAKSWGLAYYCEEPNIMIPFNIPDYSSAQVSSIYGAGENRLLLLSSTGALNILRYDFPAEGGIDIISNDELIPETKAASVFEGRGLLYIVSEDNVIYRYDCDKATVGLSAKINPDINITAITETEKNILAIASYPSGVYMYNVETGEMSMEDRLSDVNLHTLYYGSQNILWAGADGQGLRALYDDSFNMEKVSNSEISSEENYPVRAFFKDKDGNLFVGTKGNGISVLRDGKRIRNLTMKDGLGNNSVYAFTEGMDDDVILGHDGKGLNAISLKTGKVSSIMPDTGKGFGSVYSFYKDPDDGSLWMGTYRDGLINLKLEYNNGKYHIAYYQAFTNDKNDTTSISINNVFPILGCGDILWVGTRGGGLCTYDKRTRLFSRYTTDTGNSHISSNEILSLLMSKDSTLWIGTGYGLDRLVSYNDGKCVFESFTTKDGLPNNTIAGIVEDDNGNLWLSTNKGLSVFNPVSKEFKNFYNIGALQDNEYSDGAYYRDQDGLFYFGGRAGFNRFDPDRISTRTFQPKVLIRRFNVQQSPLPGFNPETDITLSYDENFFSIYYTALEYINNTGCEYSYILEGFNSDWVYAGTEHAANFTNVPPGKYTFKVRCTNGDKIWSEETTSIGIRILPPWWKTIWAYIAYAIIVFSVILAIQKTINMRMEQKHMLEMESLRRKQLADTYEAKLRFFTNIAHEFTTPLTLICGPIEQIMSEYKLPAKVEKYNRIILGNAERMQRLIQELIEFRKADTGNQKPQYSKVDLTEMLMTIIDNFSEMKEEKQIELELSVSPQMSVVTDHNAIEKILYNLISNAYKYTSDGGHINILAETSDSGTVISIQNSGKGIKPEHLDQVFDRFVILDNYEYRASKGKTLRNGIGMALAHSLVKMLSGDISVSSEPGKYTKFTVRLPHVEDDMAGGTVEPESLCAPVPGPEPEERQEEQEETTLRFSEKKTVMIVDDEVQIRDLVADVLGKEYLVIPAKDGKDAIRKFKNGIPDLIISDLNMPDMNGVELLKYLKSNDLTRFVPVIFLAFKTDIGDEIETYEMGSEVFIPKPFYPKHLKAVVHRILDNRSMLKDYYSSAISSTDIYEGATMDSEDKKFLMQMTSIIEENITDENLSPNLICEKMVISRMQLYRKLKDLTQQTPSEFIRNIKLQHAARLLKITKMTVQEVMFSSGFNNKSYFYREFSEKYKMSPKALRNESRQEPAQD